MLNEIEKNIETSRKTDRLMWFSMWFLLSIVTFGIAGVLMIYLLVKRRNAHFTREAKLEALVLDKIRHPQREEGIDSNVESNYKREVTQPFLRNAKAWALSTILIVPAFYVFYFLSSDLQRHENREHAFLEEVVSLENNLGMKIHLNDLAVTKNFVLDRYLVFTILSIGFAAVYWLYRVFNDYNRHFKEQGKLEAALLEFFRSVNYSEAS